MDRVILRSGSALTPPGFMRQGELAYSPSDFSLWIADNTGTAHQVITGSGGGGGGLTSFQGRATAAAVLTSADVTGALGYTPGTSSFDGTYASLTGKPTLFDGTWGSLTGKPTLATVATTGAYADLTGKPALFDGTYASLTGRPTLGGAAALNVGTTAGTVAAGDDSRMTALFSRTAKGLVPLSGGTSGTANYLREDGSWAAPPGTGGSGAPGGSSGQIQWNNAGSFDGVATLTGLTFATSTLAVAYGSATPAMDGTGAAGTATTAAHSDHQHPTDTSRAAAATPVLTGALTLTDGGNATTTVTLTNTGSNGAKVKLVGNGGTTPSKTLQVLAGALLFKNDAGTTILTLADNGALTATGSIAGLTGVTINKNSSGPVGAIGNPSVWTQGADGTSHIWQMDAFGLPNQVHSRTSGGTAATPAALANNTAMFLLTGYGHDGTAYSAAQRVSIGFTADALWASGSHPTRISLSTTSASSTTNTERMRVYSSGNVAIRPAGGTYTDDGTNALQVTGSATFSDAATTRANLGLASTAFLVAWSAGALVTAGTIILVDEAAFAFTINSLRYQVGTAGGSFTVEVRQGTPASPTDVTGLAAVSVSSTTRAGTNATANNVVAVGSRVEMIISAVTGSPTGATLSLNITR